MNYISPATTHYLLEISMEDLHQESRSWLSEIEFWRTELAFFQKLLEKGNAKSYALADKKTVDHFQNLILYYQGELMGEFAHEIREHEKYLGKMVEKKVAFDEQLYRETHKKLDLQLRSFDHGFKLFRKELYAFSEKHL